MKALSIVSDDVNNVPYHRVGEVEASRHLECTLVGQMSFGTLNSSFTPSHMVFHFTPLVVIDNITTTEVASYKEVCEAVEEFVEDMNKKRPNSIRRTTVKMAEDGEEMTKYSWTVPFISVFSIVFPTTDPKLCLFLLDRGIKNNDVGWHSGIISHCGEVTNSRMREFVQRAGRRAVETAVANLQPHKIYKIFNITMNSQFGEICDSNF